MQHPLDPELLDRLLGRTVPDDGCFIWQGATAGGYGRLGLRGRHVLAHVASWEAVHGPVPDGLELDHLCVRPLCINPEHLEAVTHAENMRRSTRFGGAVNRAKTHCPQGHPYSGENLYVSPSGRRNCRICSREAGRRYEARRRAA